MQPLTSGYADVNGISLYHEIYGDGEPLVLLHGGLTTIGQLQGWIEPLAIRRRVIAVELQGHGHTADTDRPLRYETLGDDVAGLLAHLGIAGADVAGHSFGAGTAMRAAIQHHDRVRRLIVISAPHRWQCWYPEARAGMGQVGAAMAEHLIRIPTGQLSRQWPEPERFGAFLDKMGKVTSSDYDWSDDIAALPMPVLLVFADNDSVPPKHVAEFFELLGGGLREPGWMNTWVPRSRLAIVPGYSHYDLLSSPEVPAIIERFLDDARTRAG